MFLKKAVKFLLLLHLLRAYELVKIDRGGPQHRDAVPGNGPQNNHSLFQEITLDFKRALLLVFVQKFDWEEKERGRS